MKVLLILMGVESKNDLTNQLIADVLIVSASKVIILKFIII